MNCCSTGDEGGAEDEEGRPVRQTALYNIFDESAGSGVGKKRGRGPAGSKNSIWEHVTITEEKDGKCWVQCNYCNVKPFQVSSVTRIVDHLLGRSTVKACTGKDDKYFAAVEKLKKEEESKMERKQRKMAVKNLGKVLFPTSSSNTSTAPQAAPASRQTKLIMKRSSPADATEAVARFFFGNKISANAVDSNTFHELVQKIRAAPLDWKPPSRQRLAGDCLEDLVKTLRRQEAPLRENVMRNGGTVLSDGWDTVDRSHLINQLVGNTEGIFFNGTIELRSTDAENAIFVSKVFFGLIDATGPLSIVQLCSDTCSVMKAAWRKVEERYPWITATPCGTHVLNLELKDFSKIAEVAEVEAHVKTVLNLFWGRKRWPRNRLREVIKANLKSSFGLYRAKATRFAGKIREMARLLRVKADLQEVVVSSEYEKRKNKFNKRGREKDPDDDAEDELEDNIGTKVKAVILDDRFWDKLVQVLRATFRIVTLLRKMDCNGSVLSQVYPTMSEISTYLESHKDKVSWLGKAHKIHQERWKYLHSPMHAAAYVLDPANVNIVKDMDSYCHAGLLQIFHRMCIRDVMLMEKCDVSTTEKLLKAASTFTSSHPLVVKRTAQLEREFAYYKQGKSPFISESAKYNARVMDAYEWWELYGQTHCPFCRPWHSVCLRRLVPLLLQSETGLSTAK